jgi:hypothetical protein
MRKQFEIASAHNKELYALAQQVATEAAEPIKTGVKGAPKYRTHNEQLSKQWSAYQIRQTF